MIIRHVELYEINFKNKREKLCNINELKLQIMHIIAD